jgi:hypothetical protein
MVDHGMTIEDCFTEDTDGTIELVSLGAGGTMTVGPNGRFRVWYDSDKALHVEVVDCTFHY